MISTQFAWLLLQVMSYAGLCHPGHKLPSVQIPMTHNSAMAWPEIRDIMADEHAYK